MPFSPASRTPLLVFAGVVGEKSTYTEPLSRPTRSPKLLLAEPVPARLVSVMLFAALLVPLVPGLTVPSA